MSNSTFSEWLDNYGRRHPLQMILATVSLGALATLILLAKTTVTPILYEAF